MRETSEMLKRWGTAIGRLWRDEGATTSLEYALMLAVVGLSAVAGYQALGGSVGDGVGAGQEGVTAVGAAAQRDAGGVAPPSSGAAAPG